MCSKDVDRSAREDKHVTAPSPVLSSVFRFAQSCLDVQHAGRSTYRPLPLPPSLPRRRLRKITVCQFVSTTQRVSSICPTGSHRASAVTRRCTKSESTQYMIADVMSRVTDVVSITGGEKARRFRPRRVCHSNADVALAYYCGEIPADLLPFPIVFFSHIIVPSSLSLQPSSAAPGQLLLHVLWVPLRACFVSQGHADISEHTRRPEKPHGHRILVSSYPMRGRVLCSCILFRVSTQSDSHSASRLFIVAFLLCCLECCERVFMRKTLPFQG